MIMKAVNCKRDKVPGHKDKSNSGWGPLALVGLDQITLWSLSLSVGQATRAWNWLEPDPH